MTTFMNNTSASTYASTASIATDTDSCNDSNEYNIIYLELVSDTM